MIKRELVIDGIELNDKGETIAVKGKVVKVIEIDDLDRTFLDHKFSKNTLRTMFWAEHRLEYCGG